MSITKQGSKLNTRNARRELVVGKRYMETISLGCYLVYRKQKNGAAGSWQACIANPISKIQVRTTIGIADDFQKPDCKTVFSYSQAQRAALAWGKEQDGQKKLSSASSSNNPNRYFTVSDGMDAYFRDAEMRGVKGVTQDKYRTNAWILPAFGNVPISKLTRAGIEQWIYEMALAPKRTRMGSGRKSKQNQPEQTEDQKRARKESANRVFATFRAALNYCINRGLSDSCDRPWQLVKRFRGTSKARTRFLNIVEQVRLVNACSEDFGQLVRGALLTGCRYGELTRFKCKDYDPVNGSMFVAESKSGKPRHVYLTEEGKELFDELTAGSDPEDFVFTNSASGRRNVGPGPSQWRSKEQTLKMHQACRKAGLEPLTFHELRHTYASMLVNKGCVLSVVADLLGHSSIEMVEKHYGHLSRNTVRDELLRAMPRLGILRKSIETKICSVTPGWQQFTQPESFANDWNRNEGTPSRIGPSVITCSYSQHF
jgi:integrase